jgi:hypothetical protein
MTINYQIPNYAKLPAEGDPRTPSETRVLAPSKGLNQLGDAFMIDNKEASELMNIMFTENGVVEKRWGYSTIAEAQDEVPKGLALYRGNTNNLVCVDGGKVKILRNNSWETITGDYTITGDNVNLTSCRKKLFVWDGIGQSTGGCMYYDGSTMNVGTKCPKGKFSVSYKQRQVTAGVDGQPCRLFFSRLAYPEIFTVTDGTQSTTDAPIPNNPNDVRVQQSLLMRLTPQPHFVRM